MGDNPTTRETPPRLPPPSALLSFAKPYWSFSTLSPFSQRRWTALSEVASSGQRNASAAHRGQHCRLCTRGERGQWQPDPLFHQAHPGQGPLGRYRVRLNKEVPMQRRQWEVELFRRSKVSP